MGIGEQAIRDHVHAFFEKSPEVENPAMLEHAEALVSEFLIAQVHQAYSLQRIARALENLVAQHGAH